MLALLSNGITSPAIKEFMGKYLIGKKTAAVVVTADNEYKTKNYHTRVWHKYAAESADRSALHQHLSAAYRISATGFYC